MMSARRTDTSSKRKRTTPQKLKSRKIFAASRHDMREVTGAEDDQENPQRLSGHHEMLHNRENVPKNKRLVSDTQPKTEKPQNKENMPGKYPSGAGTGLRGRGRPKGSKNKTFPAHPTRVYSVREGKPLVYTERITRDGETKPQKGAGAPHRGRGRPKGTTKVKPVDEDVPKRSRGRPKGSKNRKPSKSSLMKLVPQVQKMARGRPRKSPAIGNPDTPKRSRGRPSTKKLALSGTKHVERKRGRPRKLILDGAVIMSLTPKRPRGRPKSSGGYVHVPSAELESPSSNTQDDKDDDEEVEEELDDDDNEEVEEVEEDDEDEEDNSERKQGLLE